MSIWTKIGIVLAVTLALVLLAAITGELAYCGNVNYYQVD